MMDDFQMAGMTHVAREALNISHRSLMPRGPRCFKWVGAIPSGPIALEGRERAIAACTSSGVNRGAFAKDPDFALRTAHLINGSDRWMCVAVNCFVKRLEISEGLEYCRSLNEIGTLDSGQDFPERVFYGAPKGTPAAFPLFGCYGFKLV